MNKKILAPILLGTALLGGCDQQKPITPNYHPEAINEKNYKELGMQTSQFRDEIEKCEQNRQKALGEGEYQNIGRDIMNFMLSPNKSAERRYEDCAASAHAGPALDRDIAALQRSMQFANANAEETIRDATATLENFSGLMEEILAGLEKVEEKNMRGETLTEEEETILGQAESIRNNIKELMSEKTGSESTQ